jgi:chromosome segregation ATPase
MSSPQMNYQAPPPSDKSNVMMIVAVAAIVASIAANLFLLYQVNGLKDESAHSREVLQGEIDTLKENSTAMTAAQRKHLDELKGDLDTSKKQLSAQANQAKREAVSYADEKSKQLESEQQKANQQIGQVSSAVSEVSKKADSANAKIADVNNDVGAVKTDLSATKNSLDQTKTDLNANIALLRKVQGDLGGTNSMVATNGKELEELKKLGVRNIVEFTLKKQKDMQKVANISLKLDKADFKKNKFSLTVLADDKTWDKKDRNTNEPLQFYVSKSLYEIVINSVSKDEKTITGYMSSPKYDSPR